jgi:TPR repeat protein
LSANEQADTFYRLGYEFSQNKQNKAAFDWMLEAANMGHGAAQNNIGLSYLHGLGVEKNKEKSFFWFEKSAKQGLSYAQSELAMLYYQKNKIKEAEHWWQVAANQDDEYAQFNLASLFLEQKKIKKALYWLEKASYNQHPQAFNVLTRLKEEYAQ